MKTLTVQTENGYVKVNVKAHFRTGRDLWLANSFEDLKEAMAEGKPFVGHQVIGLMPKEIILNPAHIASIEDGS